MLAKYCWHVKVFMLAENIKRYRMEKGLSQEQLAQKAGITYSTLAKLESGVNQNPKVKTLQQIATALEVSLDDLMKER
jgi:transcriptional regulator with XRE-family HTH domain